MSNPILPTLAPLVPLLGTSFLVSPIFLPLVTLAGLIITAVTTIAIAVMSYRTRNVTDRIEVNTDGQLSKLLSKIDSLTAEATTNAAVADATAQAHVDAAKVADETVTKVVRARRPPPK